MQKSCARAVTLPCTCLAAVLDALNLFRWSRFLIINLRRMTYLPSQTSFPLFMLLVAPRGRSLHEFSQLLFIRILLLKGVGYAGRGRRP